MDDHQSPGIQLPRGRGIGSLRRAAADCRACPLWRDATQTVFGSGRASAAIVLVGEQPGDREDRAGEPFVGPAGELLDRALAEAGLDRRSLYLTNAVKHFKFELRGKRRIHQKPTKLEAEACRPWLDEELRRIRPAVVGLLGATAAKLLLGDDFRVSRSRGELLEVGFAAVAVATYHPSSVLRAGDDERREAFAALVDDLRVIAAAAR